jgi:hypothetical protein
LKREGGLTFTIASEHDESELRWLLRENAMAGPIAITLEREPNFFLEAQHTDSETIVARSQGRVVCLGSCTTRERFVNGEVCRVGYLGGLRLDSSVAGRAGILRRGYKLFHELQQERPADIYFTSIAAENVRALQFLERGLPGMPHYEFVGEFVTAVIAVQRGSRGAGRSQAERACEEDLEGMVVLINARNREYQFAPKWSADQVRGLGALGLATRDFWKVCRGGQAVGCAALWDQRVFKQTVVRGYSGALRWSRPLLNPVLRLRGYPRLPRPDSILRSAMISHLACPSDDGETLRALLATLPGEARRRSLDYVTMGFSEGDARLATLRRHFKVREYRSRLYVVRWPDMPEVSLNNNIPNPELALL